MIPSQPGRAVAGVGLGSHPSDPQSCAATIPRLLDSAVGAAGRPPWNLADVWPFSGAIQLPFLRAEFRRG
jgi:hypothetical protein